MLVAHTSAGPGSNQVTFMEVPVELPLMVPADGGLIVQVEMPEVLYVPLADDGIHKPFVVPVTVGKEALIAKSQTAPALPSIIR